MLDDAKLGVSFPGLLTFNERGDPQLARAASAAVVTPPQPPPAAPATLVVVAPGDYSLVPLLRESAVIASAGLPLVHPKVMWLVARVACSASRSLLCASRCHVDVRSCWFARMVNANSERVPLLIVWAYLASREKQLRVVFFRRRPPASLLRALSGCVSAEPRRA